MFRMTFIFSITSLVFLCILAGESASLAVQALPQEKPAKEDDQEKEPEYPHLSMGEKERAKRFLTGFKNKKPEKRKAAEERMVALGRGVVPMLLAQAETRHENQAESIYNCLLLLMEEQDVPVLKRQYKSKTARLRLLAVVKMASFKKPAHAAFLKDALEDEDERVRLEAALGLAWLGSPKGLGEIILNLARQRKEPDQRLLDPIPQLKGNVYSGHLFPYLINHKDPDVRIVTAELIALIGDKKLVHVLGSALRDPHNLVQAATVNSLRKLAKDQEPRKFDNVFDLVEAVDAWKKELGVGR
jgi:HEAT repeat protein